MEDLHAPLDTYPVIPTMLLSTSATLTGITAAFMTGSLGIGVLAVVSGVVSTYYTSVSALCEKAGYGYLFNTGETLKHALVLPVLSLTLSFNALDNEYGDGYGNDYYFLGNGLIKASKPSEMLSSLAKKFKDIENNYGGEYGKVPSSLILDFISNDYKGETLLSYTDHSYTDHFASIQPSP